MEEDKEIAFQLQLKEVLTASLLDGASAAPPGGNTASVDALSEILENDGLDKCERELLEQYKAEHESKRLQLDLSRQIHDRAFACEILSVPESEWRETGNYLSKPLGEGSTSSGGGKGFRFRVYVKGLADQMVGGVGVAICDENDGLLFEVSKAFFSFIQEGIEFKAINEGLEVAAMMDLKEVTIVTDNSLVHQYITGKNPLLPTNAAALAKQTNLLLRNLSNVLVSLVPSEQIKYAVELAREAMIAQATRSNGKRNGKNVTESCVVCLEDIYVDQMFKVPDCLHKYCFVCMSKHVQYKLLQGILPTCPFENCTSKLALDSCKKFLTPELFDIMSQRVQEASIPAEERVYCPFPKCSALFPKSELSVESSNAANLLSARRCGRCSGIFCMSCKVPWHHNVSCSVFQSRDRSLINEDNKLKSLARRNLWRQCPKCNHMVSLGEGCYHIYCRCGHEFCYTCGAEWKNKKATCKCPVWDETNIIYAPNRM